MECKTIGNLVGTFALYGAIGFAMGAPLGAITIGAKAAGIFVATVLNGSLAVHFATGQISECRDLSQRATYQLQGIGITLVGGAVATAYVAAGVLSPISAVILTALFIGGIAISSLRMSSLNLQPVDNKWRENFALPTKIGRTYFWAETVSSAKAAYKNILDTYVVSKLSGIGDQ